MGQGNDYSGTWMQAAAGSAQGALGIGFQRAGMAYDRRQQGKTQEMLTEIQKNAQKEMMDYQQIKELEMWEKTGYGPQMAQMKAAGLNPGLLYGMSGGGGQSIGHGGGTGVAGGTATHVNTTALGMQAGMQMALLQSQKRVLDTQADKNEAEANKTKGVDTEVAQANVESIWQGIDNARQQNTIQRLEITMRNIENYEKQASQEDRLDYIEYQTKLALRQLQIATNDATISGATVQDRIKTIQQTAIHSVLNNTLTKAQTDKTIADTHLSNKQFNALTQQIMQSWDKLGNDKIELQLKQQLQNWETDENRDAINQAINTIKSILFMQPPHNKTIIQLPPRK